MTLFSLSFSLCLLIIWMIEIFFECLSHFNFVIDRSKTKFIVIFDHQTGWFNLPTDIFTNNHHSSRCRSYFVLRSLEMRFFLLFLQWTINQNGNYVECQQEKAGSKIDRFVNTKNLVNTWEVFIVSIELQFKLSAPAHTIIVCSHVIQIR